MLCLSVCLPSYYCPSSHIFPRENQRACRRRTMYIIIKGWQVYLEVTFRLYGFRKVLHLLKQIRSHPNTHPHKVHIYKEYHSVCPLVGIGTLPPPLSPASVPLPPEPKGGGHTSPNSDDRRKSLALCLLCDTSPSFPTPAS